MDIPVYVVNQKLKITMNYKTLVSGTNGFINFVFYVSDDWDGMTLKVQFKQGDFVAIRIADSNNSVPLPGEIKAGTCNLTLYGTDGNGNIIATTDCVRLRIKQDDITGDAGETGGSSSGSGSSGGIIGNIAITDDGKGNVTILTV